MKKSSAIKMILSCILLSSLILSCNQLLNPSGSTGKLTISLSNAINAKTLTPPISMEVSSYSITGTGPGGSAFTESFATNVLVKNSLLLGEWTIVVDAFNDAGIRIGTGETIVQVVSGETSTSIIVKPVTGTGSLDLTINWLETQIVSPSLNATLLSSNGNTQSLNFIISGSSANYSSATLENGYYTLAFTLNDNGVVKAGAVDVVRIVAGQTTSGIYECKNTGEIGGQLAVTVTTDMIPPLEFGAMNIALSQIVGDIQHLSASIANYSGEVVYSWYVNGVFQAFGQNYDFGAGLSIGYYRVDVVARSIDGTRAGSTTYTVQLIQSAEEPKTFVSGIIDSDTIWQIENSPYVVNGNVLIPTGVTLTIQPGVSILYSGAYVMMVKGSLIAEGLPLNKIVFSSTPATASGTCYVQYKETSLSNSRMSDISMTAAGKAIDIINGVDGAMTISNIELINSMISAGGGTLTITNSTIQDSAVKIPTYGNGIVTIQDSLSTDSSMLCEYTSSGTMTVQRMTINGGGVSADPNVCQIDIAVLDSIFTDSSIYIGVSATGRVARCQLENSTISGYAHNPLTIVDSVIAFNGDYGIKVYDSLYPKYTEISNCRIHGNGNGIGIYMSSGTISDTDIFDTAIGVKIRNGSSTISNSNIYQNSVYNLENLTEGTISAIGNYWGTENESEIENKIFDIHDNVLYGEVVWSPYSLTLLSTTGPR
ncbi:MAG: hypothetical protein WC820_00900 [Spirochaetales bacterium]